ncbi:MULTISPECIES: hypothetical protein [unclassified Mesorhizobium]|uniref:hypothetical protein n=1 Tax=unclassified Mesorhizobium TaxID=325217 RepID=UPI00112B4759|nr:MULTISPECIES: hypothetical protein [unclassified Mesorhizobium]MBZ9898326.1 hypothetical protein [Mesorhizobium sp. BR1-1-6]TPM57410.1 hypothetical protein FJ959_11245 [Mesorhizobium sp. B2-2-4]TPM65786.1 hypothetical protein FJ965_16590 [Mesorhizobium sp. B2-2-1]TPN30473.1 hypothetical protein FJ979_30565 [Mesorhizobium sp. B1-1-6]TPN72111.1 hypothetical protein FJ984_04570 [Mesorhizobium sp. B1-1-3]
MDVEKLDLLAGLEGELTLWELADTRRMAQAAVELYGSSAATAAAHCALHAHFDGRESDYRFWCKVSHGLAANA